MSVSVARKIKLPTADKIRENLARERAMRLQCKNPDFSGNISNNISFNIETSFQNTAANAATEENEIKASKNSCFARFCCFLCNLKSAKRKETPKNVSSLEKEKS
ncbi:unnamed protein product [Blepharisma stoltei]|uniref:Uncharacterized protein n=1 Tax=Blepharisma stoltei TaxID=1481888 RepID=A0AAU9K3Q0_9CILI|nr:unnamed protein product [Blepharisma stoltei]